MGTGVETDVNAIFRALRELTGGCCDEIHGEGKPGEQLRSSISPARLTADLGWKATTPFAQGLAKTVEWFRGRG